MVDQIICLNCGYRVNPMPGGYKMLDWYCSYCKRKIRV